LWRVELCLAATDLKLDLLPSGGIAEPSSLLLLFLTAPLPLILTIIYRLTGIQPIKE
jgi:hypothetical protein